MVDVKAVFGEITYYMTVIAVEGIIKVVLALSKDLYYVINDVQHSVGLTKTSRIRGLSTRIISQRSSFYVVNK